MGGMMYESDIKGRYIVDDNTAVPRGMSKGYESRDWDEFPLGSFAAPFPLPLIPRSEWRDRIEMLDKTKGWPKDHKELSGFPSLNQNGTNYCWTNAPVQAVHYVRAMQGQPHVSLSPASVGAPVKNYRNVGGWGSQSLDYIIEQGVAPVSLWPANGINRKYNTEEVRVERQKYKVTEWWELKDKDFNQLITCLLLGYPVAIGLNWWSHEVLACKVAVQGKDDFLTDIDNSWGGWGDNGHGFLTQRKATPDDAVTPRVVLPYGGEP